MRMGHMMIAADDGSNGRELWVTGTASGASLLADIARPVPSSSPVRLTAGPHDRVAWFVADDGINGAELWRTDGTPAGTYRLTDVCPGSCDSNPAGMQLYQGQIYFAANDGVSGIELWASTPAPGSARRVRDIIRSATARGATVFLTTHDMVTADELCDRVAFLVDGRIAAVDEPRALKRQHGRRDVRVAGAGD
jgi:ELWxxDGT repeat protein